MSIYTSIKTKDSTKKKLDFQQSKFTITTGRKIYFSKMQGN